MKNLAQGFYTAAQDSNPGSRSRESKALPLSHCALQRGCTTEVADHTAAVPGRAVPAGRAGAPAPAGRPERPCQRRPGRAEAARCRRC